MRSMTHNHSSLACGRHRPRNALASTALLPRRRRRSGVDMHLRNKARTCNRARSRTLRVCWICTCRRHTHGMRIHHPLCKDCGQRACRIPRHCRSSMVCMECRSLYSLPRKHHPCIGPVDSRCLVLVRVRLYPSTRPTGGQGKGARNLECAMQKPCAKTAACG